MPPTPNGQLKFIRDVPFRNTVYHSASDHCFSVPLTSTERSQWTSPSDMPSKIRKEIDTVLNGIYGREAKGLKPDFYRFCWYESSCKDELANGFLTRNTGMGLPQIMIGI